MFWSTISQKKERKKNTRRHKSALPLVLPLMMPSRHLREKENILLFPPVDRLLFLRESVWGKAKESCLGARRPFPNTTLADMFIFWPVASKKEKKTVSVPFLRLSPSQRHCSVCLSCCFHVLLPLWRTSSPFRWVLSKPLQKTSVVFFIKPTLVLFLPQTSFVIDFL